MKNKKNYDLLIQVFCLVCIQLLFLYIIDPNELEQLLLVVLLVIVIAVTLFTSTLGGLMFSLFIIFGAGTILLLQSTTMLIGNWQTIKVNQFLQFGVILIISILLAGSIQEKITMLMKVNEKLKKDLQQFVSIDLDTSFDSAQRMEVEVKRELSRIKRHGGRFTLLLFQIDYFEEFQQVYGEKEVQHLLKTIGRRVNDIVRTSDSKFRVSDNRFALLLIETKKSSIEIILNNLAIGLQEHELLNGKKVTLTFHMSFEECSSKSGDIEYKTLMNNLEREIIFYAM
ncbi:MULTISPECIES: diguanylate cyclase domain-containing protein [unclassified Solibacillus]|uniref:diguanylate cyclase domain-containing protein n=1 Tax=unclassified Solibacillus TaxID=2637870 RepID=UPI0030FBC355